MAFTLFMFYWSFTLLVMGTLLIGDDSPVWAKCLTIILAPIMFPITIGKMIQDHIGRRQSNMYGDD